MRKPGWYWVKYGKGNDWECKRYISDGRWASHDGVMTFEPDIVGPRIPTPDEKPPTPCPDGGKCYKKGGTCGDPICVEWHADLLAAAPKPETQP